MARDILAQRCNSESLPESVPSATGLQGFFSKYIITVLSLAKGPFGSTLGHGYSPFPWPRVHSAAPLGKVFGKVILSASEESRSFGLRPQDDISAYSALKGPASDTLCIVLE